MKDQRLRRAVAAGRVPLRLMPSTDQGGNGTDSITALELAYVCEQSIPALAILALRKSKFLSFNLAGIFIK